MTNRRRDRFTVSALILGLAIASSAFAQFTINITLDENGDGTFTNSAGFFSNLPFALQPDPGPGGLASALTYGLLNPPGLTAGDLVILEPGLGVISDILRFNPNETIAGTTGAVVAYSDNSDGPDSLADKGFPTALYANVFTVIEVGPEGNNGFSYTPIVGQPGFVAGAAGPVTYRFLSDTVPEPSTAALLLSGVALIGIGRYWPRRK